VARPSSTEPGRAGQLLALNRADGAERWAFTDENRLCAFSRDGELQWHIETHGVVGTSVAGDDFLYAANGERPFAIDRC